MGQAPSGVCGLVACGLDARRQTVNGAHRPCPKVIVSRDGRRAHGELRNARGS